MEVGAALGGILAFSLIPFFFYHFRSTTEVQSRDKHWCGDCGTRRIKAKRRGTE
jgi:hypothetical protein